MRKLLSCSLVCLILFSIFSFLSFASDSSWQAAYFNKLVEIGEKPGFIKRLLTGKDSNGFYSKQIFYALNDYNQDGIPEIIVYGTNFSGEFGDNYQIYTYDKGEVKRFEITNHKGPYGENTTFSENPTWPYYTNFFFLPDGYTKKDTNDLVWFLDTSANNYSFWAIAGTPFENESVFEVRFDFQNMVINVIPIVFAEKTEPDKYQSQLQNWKENYELTIPHDAYEQVIPDDYTDLWKQLTESDEFFTENSLSNSEIPKLDTKNKILIFTNKIVESEAFWLVLWIAVFSLIAIAFIVTLVLLTKKAVRKIRQKR